MLLVFLLVVVKAGLDVSFLGELLVISGEFKESLLGCEVSVVVRLTDAVVRLNADVVTFCGHVADLAVVRIVVVLTDGRVVVLGETPLPPSVL